MTAWELEIPEGAQKLIERISVSDTGSVLVKFRHVVFVTVRDDHHRLNMCETEAGELHVRVEDICGTDRDQDTEGS